MAYLAAQERVPTMIGAEAAEWIDGALRGAMHADPARRYDVLSEFLHDLRRPSPAISGRPLPRADRDLARFRQATRLVLSLVLLLLAAVATGAGPR